MIRTLLLGLVSAGAVCGATLAADSARGGELFETLACIQCHSVNGKGGRAAPDLGRIVDRSFTPAALASTMWNHAPTMWAALSERRIVPGALTEQAAADLFAYFYAARFFEKPGDAARGKRLFAQRGCARCHGLTESIQANAQPVSRWAALQDPMALTAAMWNHAPRMLAAAASKRISWPELNAQDLPDLLVYLRNLPATHEKPAAFRTGTGTGGEALFKSKGCSSCHGAEASPLVAKIRGRTLTEIAAAFWNHAPKMQAAMKGSIPQFESGEMRELLSYLWAGQFFEDAGVPSRGKRLFAAKHCADCHGKTAPALPAGARTFTGATMVSALWLHGPRMLAEMNRNGVAWPRFEGAQMPDLIAYLNSGSAKK